MSSAGVISVLVCCQVTRAAVAPCDSSQNVEARLGYLQFPGGLNLLFIISSVCSAAL